MHRPSERRTRNLGPITPPRLGNEEIGSLVASPKPGSRERPGGKQGRSSLQEEQTEFGEGVYIISVAARLLDMHPQTLRKYERLGLVTPSRSLGMLRLYSSEDILRLRLIKHLVDTLGMNLAGVEFALNFLHRIMDLRQRLQAISLSTGLYQLMVQELEEMLGDIRAALDEGISQL